MPQTSRKLTLIVGLLLIATTLAVYAPAVQHGFINYDDDRYVTSNSEVRAGINRITISWAFTTFEQANWHPLTWISHELDCQFFQLNPFGHHLTNILLHALDVLLLFLILQWLTGSMWRSATVAALFAVHPLNVESVAWVAERKSVLSMFFLLLTIAAYGWYVRKPNIGRYLVVAGLLAAGLMSKPMVITLPFVLLLLDYWPLQRMRPPGGQNSLENNGWNEGLNVPGEQSIPSLLLEKIPLFLLSVVSAIITMIVQRAGGAVVSTARASLWLRIANATLSYGLYVKKMFWPSRLALLYPYPHSLPIWKVVLAALFLIAVTCIVFRFRKRRYLTVGWFWYLGTMVPMIGLVQVGNQAMADRYAYLPMIGIFIMLVWGLADWAHYASIEPRYLGGMGAAAIVVLSFVTSRQLSYWKDDFTLWTHALQINSNNFVAENNLGLALMRDGQHDEAIKHFRTAAVIEPADPTSQFNLGVFAQEQGDLKQSMARYEAVLQLTSDPQLRASAYGNLGTIYFAQRDYPQAKQNFDAVLKLNRAFPIVLRELGLIAQKDRNWGEAVKSYSQLVSLEPSDVNFFLLAQAFHQAGRDGDAAWAYQRAVQLSKDINLTRAAVGQMQAP
jgi:Flp pilus assembly protein TadD